MPRVLLGKLLSPQFLHLLAFFMYLPQNVIFIVTKKYVYFGSLQYIYEYEWMNTEWTLERVNSWSDQMINWIWQWQQCLVKVEPCFNLCCDQKQRMETQDITFHFIYEVEQGVCFFCSLTF